MLEQPVEDHLTLRVNGLGGMAIKLHPTISGLPDRLVLLPKARIYFVELKKPKGGIVSVVQAAIKKRLEMLGFTVLILNTKEKIDEHIN